MSETMLERAVEAVGQQRLWIEGGVPVYPDAGLSLQIVRAVLLALRDEPSHDLTAVMVKPAMDRTKAVQDWAAMIDSILSQSQEGSET